MKALKWILGVILFVGLIVGVYFFTTQNKKKVDLSIEGYTADEALRLEVQGRTIQVTKSTSTNFITSLDGTETAIGFVGGTFPMTQIVEKAVKNPATGKMTVPKFAASEREANKVLIQKLINKYDKIVSTASERFSIPKLFIYIVMAVENTEGDVLSGKNGTYVGLMQISASSAADTLVTQKKRRLLAVDDLKYFQSKLGASVFSQQSISNNDLTNAELNINVGTLHLSEQIVDNKFDLVKDMHKIFFSYNRGKNRLDNDGTKNLGIDDMIKHYLGTAHNVGAEYIIRALGPNGAADILVNDLGIVS